MIAETNVKSVVLFRIQYFQKGSGWVSVEVTVTNFVDLVPVGANLSSCVEIKDVFRLHAQENDWVWPPSLTQRLHKHSRAARNIRSAVAPDLGLVANTSQRYSLERPTEGTGDRLSKRRLAGPRRTNEAISQNMLYRR